MPTLHPPAGLRAFLDYCRERVSDADIRAGIMNDPGCRGYREACNEIRISGKVTTADCGSLFEVFETVHICTLTKGREPTLQGLNFLCFVYAAAMVRFAAGGHLGDCRPLEAMICCLLEQLPAMPPEYTRLAYEAVCDLRVALKPQADCKEVPFLTLGAVILTQRQGDMPASERWAEELIAEESAGRERWAWDSRFLLSWTWDGKVQHQWMALTRELKNPSQHAALATVIREIEESWCGP